MHKLLITNTYFTPSVSHWNLAVFIFWFTALVDAIVRKETDEIRNILESEDVDINE